MAKSKWRNLTINDEIWKWRVGGLGVCIAGPISREISIYDLFPDTPHSSLYNAHEGGHLTFTPRIIANWIRVNHYKVAPIPPAPKAPARENPTPEIPLGNTLYLVKTNRYVYPGFDEVYTAVICARDEEHAISLFPEPETFKKTDLKCLPIGDAISGLDHGIVMSKMSYA